MAWDGREKKEGEGEENSKRLKELFEAAKSSMPTDYYYFFECPQGLCLNLMVKTSLTHI